MTFVVCVTIIVAALGMLSLMFSVPLAGFWKVAPFVVFGVPGVWLVRRMWRDGRDVGVL